MEEEAGLSFGDILKVIFKRVWWVLGSIAIGILVFVLCVELWYNKSREYYSVSYEIVFPDSDSGKYPDGNTFLISDSVSKSTLEGIVASNKEDFGDIDVVKMIYSDRITVSETATQEAGGTVKKTYMLTAYADGFANGTQAVKFLRTVAGYPVDRVNAIVEGKDYRPYVGVYDNAKTYGEKIEALLSQKRYLQSEYQKLTETDKSVESKLAALDNVFTSTQRQNLEDTITAKYYVLDTENYEKNSVVRKAAIQKQIDDNNAVITALREERDKAAEKLAANNGQGMTGDNEYDNRIAALTESNQRLTIELNDIQTSVDEIKKYTDETNPAYAEKQAFDALFDSYRSQLISATEVLKSESIRIYSNNSDVLFSSNVVGKSGGMSAILAAVLGAVIGLLVPSVIICIIDLPKYKRQKYGSTAQKNEDADGKDKAEEEKE